MQLQQLPEIILVLHNLNQLSGDFTRREEGSPSNMGYIVIACKQDLLVLEGLALQLSHIYLLNLCTLPRHQV